MAADDIMSEIHLRLPGFTCDACKPFIKNKDMIKNYKETEDFRYIYQNVLERSCFQHDVAHGDFKNLNRRAATDKVLRDKAFNIAEVQNMMDINVDLLQWFINLLIKKFQVR